jgi:hypothetical protein
MQKRSYSARRINVTEKPGRLSGFSSLPSCINQPEQNETDEPPSLFRPLNAGIGLYGLSRINTRPFRFVNLRSLLFLSKTPIPKERKDFFFAGIASELTTELIQCGRISLRQTVDYCGDLQEEGFIVRDDGGRIKTIIFSKKRST